MKMAIVVSALAAGALMLARRLGRALADYSRDLAHAAIGALNP